MKANSEWSNSNKEKADVFTDHLSNIFSLPDLSPTHDYSEVYASLDVPYQISLLLKLFSPAEVSNQHSESLQNQGSDLITGEISNTYPKILENC